MKFILCSVFLLTSSLAMADHCTKAGQAQAEKWVRDDVHLRFGANTKISASTHAMEGNVYASQTICTYTTVYTFSAVDSATGVTKRYIGNSIMDNIGERPVYPTLEVAVDL